MGANGIYIHLSAPTFIFEKITIIFIVKIVNLFSTFSYDFTTEWPGLCSDLL